MITAIREVRRAKKLTLADVAARCDPPTTAQTIGRLETGIRTVSVAWLNRIAAALGVSASDLVRLPERVELPVVAILGPDGAHTPRHAINLTMPTASDNHVAMIVEAGTGDYRAGDEIWCERLAPEAFGTALNRDILAPRPAGRFLFGRLIGRDEGRLHILSPGAGARQQVIADPGWIGCAIRLVRTL